MLKLLMDMYAKAKCRVKWKGKVGKEIESEYGVLQGGIMSPNLFTEYLTDLNKYLDVSQGITIGDNIVTHLLYADDMVLCSESAKGLQILINGLYTFCTKWHLILSINKTNVMVFRKKREIVNFQFKYGVDEIAITDNYKYLGVIFSSRGAMFKNNVSHLNEKARNAEFALSTHVKCSVGYLQPVLAFKMFDVQISPILEYGSEVWFNNKELAEFEKIHLSYMKRTLRVKQSTSTVALYTDYGEDDEDLKEQNRLSVYEDLWESVDEKLQVIQTDLNTKIFSDLLTYIENAHSSRAGELESTDTTFLPEIPTAALITGVNTPDHSVMFSNLSTMLEERVTPHVALLRSKDCSNVKQIMSKTLSQFMENADLVDEDEEEVGSINVNKVSCTMSNLASWYAAISEKSVSPRKKQKIEGSSSSRKNLVVILEDFESFHPQVLQDFVTICSQHLSSIPLVLVFGIATAVTAVHQLLPHQVSSLLSMEKFQAPPSSQYLTSAIQNILLTTSVPLKLGSKVFNLLMDLFLYHDFSVQNFIRGYKFSMMEHFLTNRLSNLCQPLEESVNIVRFMRHSEVENVRRIVSFRRHVENSEPKTQIALLQDDRHTKSMNNNTLDLSLIFSNNSKPDVIINDDINVESTATDVTDFNLLNNETAVIKADKETPGWVKKFDNVQAVMMIIGLLLNVITLVTLNRNGSGFNPLICSLFVHQAFADSGVCIMSILLLLVPPMALAGPNSFKFFVCQVFHSQVTYWSVSWISITNLELIAWERYMAICKPLKHGDISKGVIKRIIIFMYPLSLCVTCLGFVQVHYSHGKCLPEFYFSSLLFEDLMRGFSVWCFLILYAIPFAVFVASYGSIVYTLLARQRQTQLAQSRVIDAATKQLTKTAMVVTTWFIIALGYDLWYYILGYNNVIKYQKNSPIQKIGIFLAGSNSCVNPIIYVLFMPAFRESLRKTFGCQPAPKPVDIKPTV
uniref:Putative origin recognition complex subunit 3 protein n=1 Tax=Platynereis dumerilii TaxID=6359 RepID=Q2WBW5_PLADU|nr:putative origin recognition complex subunit 3 protein [Platynereis dumerilii]